MAVLKKKTMRLNEMLDTGIVKEGDLLRYKACPEAPPSLFPTAKEAEDYSVLDYTMQKTRISSRHS